MPGRAEPGSTKARVLLAEDLDLLRAALSSLLSREPDLAVVAALRCHEHTVLAMALNLRPDVAVVDLGTAPIEGLAIIEQLRGHLPGCQVVALVPAHPPGLVRRVLAAGVRGAIDSTAPATRLLTAIRGVTRARTVIDPQLAVAALRVRPNPLSARELNVLRLAADGNSGPAIARHLHLSAGTVRNYLSNAITKTRARTRVDAIRIAHEAGWL